MKEGRNKQSDINGKPVDKIIYSRKIFMSVCGFLYNYKIYIITEIHQDRIGNKNRNDTYNRSFRRCFGPWKFLIEKIVDQTVSRSQKEGIHCRDQQGLHKILNRQLICKKEKEKQRSSHCDPE